MVYIVGQRWQYTAQHLVLLLDPDRHLQKVRYAAFTPAANFHSGQH